jgi:ubiquinone/menaquinone biosynthesis C-methylase UbiE
MKATILSHFANVRAEFLHAGGEKATTRLIILMALNGNEKNLEFGFGSGATLTTLGNIYPDLSLTGIEQNEDMYRVAKQPIRFSGIRNVKLILATNNILPHRDNTIDVVYAESVFGIMTTHHIREFHSEAYSQTRPHQHNRGLSPNAAEG